MDLQRDIGALEARIDEHDKRVNRIEEKIDAGFQDMREANTAGFSRIHQRIDELAGAENRRKGAISLIRMFLSGGVITGVVEGVKTLLGGHK